MNVEMYVLIFVSNFLIVEKLLKKKFKNEEHMLLGAKTSLQLLIAFS
jgi:hypothetical protein